MFFPEIPKSYLVALLLVGLVVLRLFGIDTYVTALLSAIGGYILGKHIEQGNYTEE